MKTKIKKSELKDCIRDIPDFPKKGILFKDITTLLANPLALKKAVDLIVKQYKSEKIDAVIGIESRGFIFGAAIAYKLGVGFIPVRKKGKLPYKTRFVTYDLEYGTDTLEMHEDAIKEGQKVLLVDDLLATGGTVEAVVKLVREFKAQIAGVAFLVELSFLKGKKKLEGLPVYSIIKY